MCFNPHIFVVPCSGGNNKKTMMDPKNNGKIADTEGFDGRFRTVLSLKVRRESDAAGSHLGSSNLPPRMRAKPREECRHETIFEVTGGCHLYCLYYISLYLPLLSWVGDKSKVYFLV